MSPKREKLSGYRQSLDVYEVFSCPQNESSWRTSAANLGCTIEIKDPATDLYYCIPNQSKTRLVEFCYDRRSEGTIKGVCQELDESGILQDYDCKKFIKGCPVQQYLTETIYKYPSCLRINAEQRCYLAEEDCPPLSSVTTDSQFSTTLESSVNLKESLINDGSITTSSPYRDNSNLTKSELWTSSWKCTSSIIPIDTSRYVSWEVFIPCFTIITVLLILVLAVVIQMNRRRKRRYLNNNDEETGLIDVDDKQKERTVHDIHIVQNINLTSGQRATINDTDTWSQTTDSNTTLTQDFQMKAAEENESDRGKGKIYNSKTDKDTREGGVITNEDSKFILETNLLAKAVKRCQHISSVSSECAWVSDDYCTLMLINKLGDIEKEISATKTARRGSHTMTKNGDFLFINSDNKNIYRDAEEKPILYHRNYEDMKMLCMFSSPINGDLLIGGQYYDQQGVVIRCSELGDSYLSKIQIDDAGRNLFKTPQFITENTNGDVIVSDYDKRAIVVVEKSGKHRFTYHGPPLNVDFRPCGVCTDTFGCIMVCDPGSQSVHILAMDGKYLFNLPTSKDGITSPNSVCMDNQHHLWVVDDHTNKMLIYRLP